MLKRTLNFKSILNFATIHTEEKYSYRKHLSHNVPSKWSEWFNTEQNKKRHSTESSPLTIAMWTTQRAVGYSLSVFASSHCVANFRSPSNGGWDTSVEVPPEPETGISIEASWPVCHSGYEEWLSDTYTLNGYRFLIHCLFVVCWLELQATNISKGFQREIYIARLIKQPYIG